MRSAGERAYSPSSITWIELKAIKLPTARAATVIAASTMSAILSTCTNC